MRNIRGNRVAKSQRWKGSWQSGKRNYQHLPASSVHEATLNWLEIFLGSSPSMGLHMHFDQALLHGAWERAPKTYLCKRPASQPPQNFDLWIRCSASAQAFGYPKAWIGCEHTDEHTFERWYHLLESRHRVQTSQHPYCRSQHHPTSTMQLGNSKYQQLLWAKHQVMW